MVCGSIVVVFAFVFSRYVLCGWRKEVISRDDFWYPLSYIFSQLSTHLSTMGASEYQQMVPHAGHLHLRLCREGLAVYWVFRGCAVLVE
ncbi:hypothetical protein B9Z19DRAFT_282970 [Tuber borchii]|uniref:Uncharacterized protein n=1 Tax=Tuber borchii TaxID=42251 RepID=A0A2T6ZL16_TUBBO|nr:hypothetical protein B9Z19DRAFT_282970 [Tuber borchii]